MIDFNSPEFYTLALVIAIALVGLLFGERDPGPASTGIAPFTLNPCVTDAPGRIALHALDDGDVMVLRDGMPVNDGDTVNIVATVVGDKVTIVEKRGVYGRGEAYSADGTATLSCLGHRRYHVRYESELTGQWALFTFKNTAGNTVTSHLKL